LPPREYFASVPNHAVPSPFVAKKKHTPIPRYLPLRCSPGALDVCF
jgi:hypothetical protein